MIEPIRFKPLEGVFRAAEDLDDRHSVNILDDRALHFRVMPAFFVPASSMSLAKPSFFFGCLFMITLLKHMVRPEVSNDQPTEYTISLHDVHFTYGDTEVLHGINMEIADGTVNALVGPSGSGKSTIARLIASLWDVDSGTIEIGGVNIKDMPLVEYNKHIAYVSQENYLFDQTVMDNIRMGRADATDEEVIEAAKKCGCHDFIMSLENGYQTVSVISSGATVFSISAIFPICSAP